METAKQINFLETQKDPQEVAAEVVGEQCREVASKCVGELIDMALGKTEVDKDRRIAIINVLEIAIGNKFRSVGRPKGKGIEEINYKELMSLMEPEKIKGK